MLQAMLCDDNEIILEGLSRQIDWEGLGICLSGTAADGQDAWNQMKDNPPDILITDIRMPYIDGLELSRLARDLNPNIVLLIISAYDDFEYARTAMHLRALDYILKPIDLDTMNRILSNAVSHCRQFHQDKRLMATQQLRNLAVQETADPEGVVWNELDLAPDSWCCSCRWSWTSTAYASFPTTSGTCQSAGFSPEPDFVQGQLLSAGIPSVQLQRLPRLPVQDGAVRPAENFGGRHTQAVSPRGKLL